MKKLFNPLLSLFLAVFATISLASSVALAHERRQVDKYQLVVGFIVEPALEGQKNGVDLRVTNAETQKPVTGVEQTLRIEITHMPTGVSRTFDLRTIFGDPGHYTADLLPTAPGFYRLRFFGAIEGSPVNETFNSRSGGGSFNDVEPSGQLQFPQKIGEVREVESATRGALAIAQQAENRASRANTTAIIAVVVGGLGLATGAGSLVASWRKKA